MDWVGVNIWLGSLGDQLISIIEISRVWRLCVVQDLVPIQLASLKEDNHLAVVVPRPIMYLP